MVINNEVSILLEEISKILSEYCSKICKAKCCRTGHLLLLNNDEISFICGEEKERLLKERILTYSDLKKGYKLDLKKFKCPYLTKNFRCKIHSDKRRPIVCKEFPIFIRGKFIILATEFCPAIKEGKLNKIIKKFEKLGYKII